MSNGPKPNDPVFLVMVANHRHGQITRKELSDPMSLLGAFQILETMAREGKEQLIREIANGEHDHAIRAAANKRAKLLTAFGMPTQPPE